MEGFHTWFHRQEKNTLIAPVCGQSGMIGLDSVPLIILNGYTDLNDESGVVFSRLTSLSREL
jgi:hypothetical protein